MREPTDPRRTAHARQKCAFETLIGFAIPSIRANEILCGIAMAVALLMGGATQKGVLSDTVVQAASLPVILIGIFEAKKLPSRGGGTILALLSLIVIVPSLQLIPLPISIWERLPGREAAAETFQAVGLLPTRVASSLSPWATERSAFCLLPAIAIYLGFLSCRPEERRRLWVLVALMGVLCVILQALQLAEGPGSDLRYQVNPTPEGGIGFFANRNHTAAFLYSLIPVSAYIYVTAPRRDSLLAVSVYLAFNLLIVIGLAMTFSKSAFPLGIAAWIFSYVFILMGNMENERKFSSARYVAGMAFFILFASGLAFNYGLDTIFSRFAYNGVSDEVRWMLDKVSLSVLRNYWPLGSGLGTFERVFPLAQNSSTTLPAVVNHVHNDFLELLIETGIFGASIIFLWVWIGIRSTVSLAHKDVRKDGHECVAGLIVCVLLLIHSFWEYPLRTCAISAIFAAACAAGSSALLSKRT